MKAGNGVQIQMKYDLDYYDFDVFSSTFGEEFTDRSIMGFDGNDL